MTVRADRYCEYRLVQLMCRSNTARVCEQQEQATRTILIKSKLCFSMFSCTVHVRSMAVLVSVSVAFLNGFSTSQTKTVKIFIVKKSVFSHGPREVYES